MTAFGASKIYEKGFGLNFSFLFFGGYHRLWPAESIAQKLQRYWLKTEGKQHEIPRISSEESLDRTADVGVEAL